MNLPSQTSSYGQRVRFGRYVGTRLRADKQEDKAAAVDKVTSRVKDAGRKVDDASEPVQAALALRDASDNGLDGAAQNFRLTLASRGLNAVKEAPYTRIFHQGIGYYIAAPLSGNEIRYKEPVARVEAALSESDPLRIELVSAVTSGLKRFVQAVSEVARARTALAMARTECDAAKDEWEALMVKTYGALIVEKGKKEAERFFPRTRRADPDAAAEAEDTKDE